MRAAQYLIDQLELIEPERLNERERRAYLAMLNRLARILEEFLADCA